MAVLIILLAAIVAVPVALVLFNAVLAWRTQAGAPPCGRFATIDGVRLHYLDRGDGPPVVLLHGLASQLQTYTYAMCRLLEPRYRLIMVDRPGSGYSAAAPDASLDTQADLVTGLLRELGIDRAIVVGHSLGGALALAMAIRHPEQVAGLALIAPATQPQDAVPDALSGLVVRSKLMRWVFGWTIAAPLAISRGQENLKTLFAPDPVPADFATRGGALLSLRPWTFRNSVRDLEALASDLPRNVARYGEIAVPVDVLYGAGDRILDGTLHGGRLAEQIADVRLAFVEDGGHMTPFCAPERCAAMVDDVATRAGFRAERAAPVH